VMLTAVVIESADLMQTDDGSPPPVAAGYAAMLGPAVQVRSLERFAFYQACRGDDVAAIVATGDQRLFANLLLTLGVVA
jgi:L-fucose mutarotase